MRALRRLFPDTDRFAVHEALNAVSHLADEGAANHVRLCADHGEPGVNLMVWGRDAWEVWSGRFPARQTLEASEAVVRLSRRADGGRALSRVRKVRLTEGRKSQALVKQGVLQVVVSPRQGLAGRPSSDRIIAVARAAK